ncbi:hypothetical protein N2152v2_009454 [Parachlorella kessleri]
MLVKAPDIIASEFQVPSYLSGKSAEFQGQVDALLEVQGREFPVHKQLLAAASPFFDELFLRTANGANGCYALVPQEGADEHPLTASNLELFLNIVEEAEDILPLADFLGEEPLVQRCCKLISNPLHLQAFIQPYGRPLNTAAGRGALRKYLGLASRYKLRELMAQCLPYLVEDIFVKRQTEAIEDICDATILKVMFGVLVTHAGQSGFGSSMKAFGRGSNTPIFKYETFLERLSESRWGK